MVDSSRVYMVRLEARVSGGFVEPDKSVDERLGEAEALALHEGLLDVPDALGPSVGSFESGSLGSVLEVRIAVEASSFGAAVDRAVAAYRSAALHIGLDGFCSCSEGTAVVFVEVLTEEEFDRRMAYETG